MPVVPPRLPGICQRQSGIASVYTSGLGSLETFVFPGQGPLRCGVGGKRRARFFCGRCFTRRGRR